MSRRVLAVAAILLTLLLRPTAGDEGMYPITSLARLNLKAKGLRIDAREIYNPKGTSLIEAVVQLGGCTGSFVSPEGLIITNHHCVFGAVQAASSVQQDYLTNGFLAASRPQEIPARGMVARITEEMRDVSAEVTGVAAASVDPIERAKAIDARIEALTKEAQASHPGKAISISEMLPGKSYLMFISTVLRDVRLAYVPPRSIGEFGGEDDNWVWPRHTGDFSFVRAYAAPDGKPAEYSTANVPYRPKRFLKVNPRGVNEEEFVFILGYPGRTYRHQTSFYLAYEENQRMPFVADLNEWQIKTMEELGRGDRAVALKFDSRIKGLANTMKNYRGKLAGMKRLGLVAAKRAEEAGLQRFIEGDPQRRARYGTVLEETGRIYAEMAKRARYELVLDSLSTMSQLMRLGNAVFEAGRERAKPDAERLAPYKDANVAQARRTLAGGLANVHEPADRLFARKVIGLASQLPADQRIAPIDERLKGDFSEQNIARVVDEAFASTRLKEAEGLASAVGRTAAELEQQGDPFISLARDLAPLHERLREVRRRRAAELSRLSALLIDVKQQYLQRDFVPDANSTLRFTYGRVRGYSPADATFHAPITTLAGVIEKTRDEFPYATPPVVRDLFKAKDFGRYALANGKGLPVALLYNADTTGGNSGSPLMNAKGELVGVNFDRAWGATINDYAWNEGYSRSIAVDVRYVLWVTEKVGKAGFLVQEMGVR